MSDRNVTFRDSQRARIHRTAADAAPECWSMTAGGHPAGSPVLLSHGTRSIPPSLDVSIIIVNWNSASILGRSLLTVDAELAGVAGECLVVDNASAPGDLAQLRRRRPAFHLIANDRNLGFAAAVNQGLARSRGRFALLLNPDAFLHPGCLRHLIAYLDAHPEAAIVAPRILDPDGNVQGSARAFPGPLTALFGRTGFLTRRFPGNRISLRHVPALASAGDRPMPVDWVSGACLLARRQALDQVGPLDERFFLYWEDADLCWRMRRHGWQVIYDPRVSVVHLVGASSSLAPARSTIAFHRSAYRLYRKHVVERAWHPLSMAAAIALSSRAVVVATSRWLARWSRARPVAAPSTLAVGPAAVPHPASGARLEPQAVRSLARRHQVTRPASRASG